VHVPAHIQGTTTQFTEADHPRGSGGKFATKPHPEQDVDLTAPASGGKEKATGPTPKDAAVNQIEATYRRPFRPSLTDPGKPAPSRPRSPRWACTRP